MLNKKIKITIGLILTLGATLFIYVAAQLTKLSDLDILDISDDDEEELF